MFPGEELSERACPISTYAIDILNLKNNATVINSILLFCLLVSACLSSLRLFSRVFTFLLPQCGMGHSSRICPPGESSCAANPRGWIHFLKKGYFFSSPSASAERATYPPVPWSSQCPSGGPHPQWAQLPCIMAAHPLPTSLGGPQLCLPAPGCPGRWPCARC